VADNIKTIPKNIEAEELIIGSIIINPNILHEVREIITFEDFYSEKNQKIFKAIEMLDDNRKPVDIITITDKLENMGVIEEIGGYSELVRIHENVHSYANHDYYCKIVKEKSIQRELIEASTEIINDSFNPEDFDDLLDKAEKKIFKITSGLQIKSYSSLNKIVKDEIIPSIAEARITNQGIKEGAVITGLNTGYKNLNRFTSGFQRSDLIIIAGRPSMGKTSLALSIAKNMAVVTTKNPEDYSVAFFSLEMSETQLVTRLLSVESNVELYKLRNATIDNEEWVKVTDAAGRLSSSKFYIDDEPILNPRVLSSKARKMKLELDIDAIFIDYLQLMQIKNKKENRQQEITDITRSMKLLARELDIPIICLSQLSRAVEKRDNKRPMLSDLRESGAIEQDADVVIFLYRDEYYKSKNEDSDDENYDFNKAQLTEIIIAKQRNGPTATLKLSFLPKTTGFFLPYEYGNED
jgi:replicative DNA helicase